MLVVYRMSTDESIETVPIENFGHPEKVQIVGFGAFEVKERPARKARTPKTGEEIQIGARRSPMFKPGKALKEAVVG